MSKPREPWWPYILNIIRRYPEMKQELQELQSMTHRPDNNGGGGGHSGGENRPVERAALRSLPAQRQKEYDAVKLALDITIQKEDGCERVKLIRKMYFGEQRNTIQDLCRSGTVFASESTARRWHQAFVCEVARCLGLIEPKKPN